MKKLLLIVFFLSTTIGWSQTNFSDSWEDFFSYNNVKDIEQVNDLLVALSDNAIFTFNTNTQDIQKISSVHGLSGETTSSILYSEEHNRIVIGYENGLIEIVEEDGSITVAADIVNFNQTGSKRINDLNLHDNTIYISTPFAIIEYDIQNLEFGDTFFIGSNSSDIEIFETVVVNDNIYAATENGIFQADVTNDNLIDFNNWTQNFVGTSFKGIESFNNQIITYSGSNLYRVENQNLNLVRNYFETIVNAKATNSSLGIALNKKAVILNDNLNQLIEVNPTEDFDFSLNNVMFSESQIYLGTKQFGILSTTTSNPSDLEEIHPEGPINNDVFSITAQEGHLWVVYGGYAGNFAPTQRRLGYTHFDGTEWVTVNYSEQLPLPDLVDVAIDPQNINRVFISSFGSSGDINSIKVGGLFEVVENEIVNYYNHQNSPLEDVLPNDPNTVSIRLSNSKFDAQGNLWVTNVGAVDELKKFTGTAWQSIDISAATSGFGFYDLEIDRSNSVWIASRGNGVIAYNENGNKLRALTTQSTQGSLPNLNVRSIAIDRDNRLWIGTISGLVVLNNALNVFDNQTVDAQPIIFLQDGIARRLLDEELVTAIVVDGANNKWFGTDNGGVVYTNPNGQTTLATFNKGNSPLPSNRINKIAVDESNGKVYFATDKGMVAYDSNVSPFGETLGEVYAYPNPVRKFHETVTIDGRNGVGLPKGTNVKILDISGNLVYETNVVEGQQLNGGKVIWNKHNLAGNKVASGVYIVLLSNEDASETSTTKIAIIN